MTTNPNLLFALSSIPTTTPLAIPATTTIATPLGPHRTLARFAKDPRHGCINSIKISTCKTCAGHVSRTKKICTGCKGTGSAGARCSACAISAVLALRALIKEVATDVQAGDEKGPKAPDQKVSAKGEILATKDTAETKDENGQDELAKTVED
ncbi:hypothetical protein E4T44_04285 [Aureobasidium sp. EXF-8845]|nr:hypothetical protein E4T44_04285 [Aureobasidium sp. EXF-8845]KAI4855069.1 hypothetical protein E4T45_03499 [Aureobasidium sp. EXF-8846]